METVESRVAPCTQGVAEFVAATRFASVPSDAVESYKRLILDALSCGIGGIGVEVSAPVIDLMGRSESGGRSLVWATGATAEPRQAAYVNATLTNALDFDDTYSGAGHPGATVVPVVLATAEAAGASGEEVIAAVATGYEVTVRLGLALSAGPFARTTAAFGYGHQTLGAAAAVSNVAGFPAPAAATALGIAAAHSPVPYSGKLNLSPADRPLAWVKNNYGWMALAAVLACELTERGFVGPKDILDGPDGYWVMVGSDQFHTDALLDGLGVEFLSAGTEHKPYASCRWTHSAIEAADRARRLLDESDVDSIDTIASIDVDWFGDPATFDVVTPLDGIDAQFSLPFLVGAALAGSAPTTHIGEQELHSPTIRGLAEKVTVTKVAEFARAFATGGRPARVTVTCSSGRRFVETVEVPMGHPARRLTWDAVCAKSESLVSPVLGEKAANRLIERCRDLESLDGIASLWDEVFE